MLTGWYFSATLVSLGARFWRRKVAFKRSNCLRFGRIDLSSNELRWSDPDTLSYEVGRRRMAVSALPTLAKLLGVSLEELIGEEPKPGKRGPTPKLARHMERISQLPKTQQRFVMQMLETVLAQASR